MQIIQGNAYYDIQHGYINNIFIKYFVIHVLLQTETYNTDLTLVTSLQKLQKFQLKFKASSISHQSVTTSVDDVGRYYSTEIPKLPATKALQKLHFHLLMFDKFCLYFSAKLNGFDANNQIKIVIV